MRRGMSRSPLIFVAGSGVPALELGGVDLTGDFESRRGCRRDRVYGSKLKIRSIGIA